MTRDVFFVKYATRACLCFSCFVKTSFSVGYSFSRFCLSHWLCLQTTTLHFFPLLDFCPFEVVKRRLSFSKAICPLTRRNAVKSPSLLTIPLNRSIFPPLTLWRNPIFHWRFVLHLFSMGALSVGWNPTPPPRFSPFFFVSSLHMELPPHPPPLPFLSLHISCTHPFPTSFEEGLDSFPFSPLLLRYKGRTYFFLF